MCPLKDFNRYAIFTLYVIPREMSAVGLHLYDDDDCMNGVSSRAAKIISV